MPGLFSLDVSDPGGDVVGIQLDPRDAFLADHRVGGRPLLSTVLGVEALASALVARHPELTVAAVERIVVGPPLFVDHLLPATVTSREVHPARFSMQLRSDTGLHLTAELIAGRQSPRAEPHAVTGSGREGGVDASEIYALYFHGPAFRVIERAWWSGETMQGELASGRPDLRDTSPATITAPLLTELCLQTAGLRELAVRGVMGIPRSIDRIARRGDRDAGDGGGASLRAVVWPADPGEGGPSIDADVIDEDGNVQLEVRGYRTTPLAAPFDAAAAALVRRRLPSVPAG